jgi:acyl-CoA hydrolase
VGDFIVLKRVTATSNTSLEVEVLVYSEAALSGDRQMTSRAILTFVTLERDGARNRVPPLLVEPDDRTVEAAARDRHAAHLHRGRLPR